MTAEVPHLKIHVAKAKDLPLSWFELILCPDKFKKHLETLSKNPDGVYLPVNAGCSEIS